MDYDIETTSNKPNNNAVNIPLAWAMFGGSTFVLFLLCYFCQKKLQYGGDDVTTSSNRRRTLPPRQVYVISNMPSQQTIQGVTSELALSTPPPDYQTVVKKDCFFPCEGDDPPPYEVAIAEDNTEKARTSSS